MKRMFKGLFLFIALFGVFITAQPVTHASSANLTLMDLNSGQTYNSDTVLINSINSSNKIDLMDANNGMSLIVRSASFEIVLGSGGNLSIMYELGGNFVSLSGNYQSVILNDPSGSNITIDYSGGTLSKEVIQVTANDLRPGFSGQETFATNVSDAKPLSHFLQYIKVYDNVDGDLTDQIYIITDNYTTNKNVLGTWSVKLGVEDSAGNVSEFTFNIQVADITAPVINGNTSKVQISYTQTYNITSFKNSLTVSDNYDTIANSKITIKSDNYTANKTNLGTYDIVFEVADNSGNKSTFTKQIEVVDDVAPTWTGQNAYTKDATAVLTVDTIKANLSANDLKDGNRTAYITVKEDNYTGKGNRVGTYSIIFEVADTKGNKSTFTVTIDVRDDIPGVWYIVNGSSFVLIPPMKLTQNQIIELLQRTNQIQVTGTTNVNFFLDEYTGNEATPGVYNMGFNLSNSAGQSSIHNFVITVTETADDDQITITPDESFLAGFTDFVSSNKIMIIGLLSIGLVLIVAVSVATNKKPARKRTYKKRK